jgi:hypothetical protein
VAGSPDRLSTPLSVARVGFAARLEGFNFEGSPSPLDRRLSVLSVCLCSSCKRRNLSPRTIPPVCPSYIVSSELPKVYIGVKPELHTAALQDNVQYFYLTLIVQKPVLKIKGHFSRRKPKLTVAMFFYNYNYVSDIYRRTGVETSQFAEDGNSYTSNRNTNFAISNLQRDRKLK